MKVVAYWSRLALLPCGSEVEVEYKVFAEVSEDEHEVTAVFHVDGFRNSRESLAPLDIDEWDCALSTKDRKRLEKALTEAAVEESASKQHDAAEARQEG